MVSSAWALLGFVAACAGVWLLRRAWRRRGGAGFVLGGWLALAAGAPAWLLTGVGADKAVALGVLVPGILALAMVAAAAELPKRDGKSRRQPKPEIEPPLSSGPAWRGWVRLFLAGPLGVAAGVAVSAAIGLHGMGSDADRVLMAGLLLPMVWAGALVWATTDERLGRVAAGLGALTIAGVVGACL